MPLTVIRTCFELSAHLAEHFRESGLGYEDLMTAALGARIALEPAREARQFHLSPGGGAARLGLIVKRNWEATPLSWVLKKLVRGRIQRSRPWLEAEALLALKRAGFAVNEPIAWGERRRLGVPLEGFLVVREVGGLHGPAFWASAGSALRARFMRDVGALMGRLHGAGFLERVRTKDVFCGEVPSDPREPIPICLIDREMSKGRVRRVTTARLADALAHSYVGFLIASDEPTLLQLSRFAAAYVPHVPAFRGMPLRGLLALVRGALDVVARESSDFAATVARSRWMR